RGVSGARGAGGRPPPPVPPRPDAATARGPRSVACVPLRRGTLRAPLEETRMLTREAVSLDGKVAVVTGGGGGIGRGIAETFAEHAARVVVAERDAQRAEETARAIEKRGGKALACVVDVQERADVAKLASATLSAFRRI